jgi:perosamine synthetase
MESLPSFLSGKRKLAELYESFFRDKPQEYIKEPNNANSNYWLNAIIMENLDQRNAFLEQTNNNGVMTRPIWKLMNHLSMFKNAQTGNLENSQWLEDRVVNIPSSVKI